MTLSTTQLIGFQRAEFNKASQLRLWLILFQFLVAMPAVISVFSDSGIILYYLAIAGAILLILWAWFDHKFREHRSAAERARRATLLISGLGYKLSAHELFDLQESFVVSGEEAKGQEDSNYFASPTPPGAQRLSEMLEESAFWTSKLQADSAKVMLSIFLGCIILFSILVSLVLPSLKEVSVLLALARAFLAFLVFLLSSDVWGAVSGHFEASRTVQNIRLRLVAADAAGYPPADVFLAMGDYNAAVEAAPMSVPFIYKLRKARLNSLWASYQQARAGIKGTAAEAESS